MKSLIITPKNKKELKLINLLVKQLGIKHSKISLKQLEDFTLAKLMQEVDRTKKVSKEEVFHKK